MKKILSWAKPSLLLFSFLLSLSLSTTALASFDDVDATHPYYEGISYLELIGAVDPGTNFRPDDFLPRAAFFKMLFKTLHEDPETAPDFSFTDVPDESWYAPYARLARFYKLVEGETFEGQINLNKGSVLGLLMKAYGLGAPIIPLSQRSELFEDVGTKHPLYSLIYQADRLGLVEADLNANYEPFVKITRGELADMIYKMEVWENEVALEETDDFYKSDILADVWYRIMNEFYLPDGYSIDEEVLFQAAVDAVLESLNDPYSLYFAADQATEFTTTLDGEFEGVGALLNQDPDSLAIFIAEIFADTPAAESGLKVGDVITAVDEVSVEGMSIEEVINRIKGNAGTEVRITVLRDGEPHSYLLVRAVIGIDLVTGEIYHKDAWLIKISSFSSNIYEDMMLTLEALTAEESDPSAIILDLRGNPGGYVNMGNFVAGLFVPHLTPLVTLDYGEGAEETIYNGDYGTYQDVPTYILVDQYTASASEILALTLQEVSGATVIGTQTYGKGSAQEIITYWDGSLLKLTIANWLSSQGNSVEGVGVTPDILVTPTDGEADEWLKALNEEL